MNSHIILRKRCASNDLIQYKYDSANMAYMLKRVLVRDFHIIRSVRHTHVLGYIFMFCQNISRCRHVHISVDKYVVNLFQNQF